MLRYLIPKFDRADLLPMLQAAAIGAVIAGSYGILHDQITYSISPEYFTRFKFDQFAYANFGVGDRVFVAAIGFLATWWVGMFAGWFLARYYFPGCSHETAWRNVFRAIGCMFLVTFLFGAAVYGYGLSLGPGTDLSTWQPMLHSLRVEDGTAFVRVGMIHNAGYLGALVGLVLAILLVRRSPVA
ncbi:hypothetical protein [Bremerella cremea]|uniref:hypothetical protein n=1 Tax=Bremerella cremea TaxID=1031537 RepID=UPI0031EF3FB0